jgi:hypothetical protein
MMSQLHLLQRAEGKRVFTPQTINLFMKGVHMVDYFPVSPNRKFPKPAPDPEEIDEVTQDAIVDVVLNIYEEKRDAKSITLRISFRLPDNA